MKKIIKIEKNNKQHVYDIEVDTVHAFVAKNPDTGLTSISHNSARMSIKFWKDKEILDFIKVKRPIEYLDMKMDEILKYRDKTINEGKLLPNGFLWSSNNSVAVDKEFWDLLSIKRGDEKFMGQEAQQARRVFRTITESAYADGTGEPGIINVDKLVQKDEGWEKLKKGDYIGNKKYELNEDTEFLIKRLTRAARRKKYHTITNPCIDGNAMISTHLGDITMKEVVRKVNNNEEILVKVNNNYNKVVSGCLTKKNAEVIELIFTENNKEFKLICTPDHKIKTSNRGWVNAENLNEKDNIIVNDN